MSVKIGHASIDERGKAKSGTAGDQTGKELCTRTWYAKGWNVLLRPKSATVAEKMAKACEAGGADGVSLINTLLGMRIDLKKRKPIIANKTGGYSGPAIKPVAVRMIYQVYDAVKIPIVGMGGVATAEDVIEFMLAGARAVEVGAENLVNPYAARDIILDLPRVMEKYGINSLEEIIGGAH